MKQFIMILIAATMMACSGQQEQEAPQEMTAGEKAAAQLRFNLAMAEYDKFVTFVKGDFFEGTEESDEFDAITKDLQSIKFDFPNSPYKDSAIMYIDSLRYYHLNF